MVLWLRGDSQLRGCEFESLHIILERHLQNCLNVAAAATQLVELLLLIPEVLGSNLVIGKLYQKSTESKRLK